MEVTIKIDKRSKQAKAILEMLKTFDFVQFVGSEEQEEKSLPNMLSEPDTERDSYNKEQFVEELSKKVNKAAAEKWYKKSEISY